MPDLPDKRTKELGVSSASHQPSALPICWVLGHAGRQVGDRDVPSLRGRCHEEVDQDGSPACMIRADSDRHGLVPDRRPGSDAGRCRRCRFDPATPRLWPRAARLGATACLALAAGEIASIAPAAAAAIVAAAITRPGSMPSHLPGRKAPTNQNGLRIERKATPAAISGAGQPETCSAVRSVSCKLHAPHNPHIRARSDLQSAPWSTLSRAGRRRVAGELRRA